MPQTPTPAPESAAPPARLMSLDALRGFDMMWIVGGGSLVYALQRMRPTPLTSFLADQCEHVDWAGFHFYDLIFPLFVFMVGVSAVFSLSRALDDHGLGLALQRVVRRSALLFVIALLYSGGFSKPWPELRLLGVLNLIAVSYCGAGLSFCLLRRRPTALAGVCAGLLLGYAALLLFVPYPDVRPVPGGDQIIAKETGFTNSAQLNFASTNRLRGCFRKGVTLANYVDQRYLPGRKWEGTWDPEGLLTPLGGTACCLLGVFAGLLLQAPRIVPRHKVPLLLVGGAMCVAAGFLWGQWLPVIKKIWSPSFVLVAGGYSALLLGAFYLVVDVAGWRRWGQPFVWIGMNPITIYILNSLLGGYEKVAARFVGGSIERFFDAHVAKGLGGLTVAAVGVLLAFLVARFLYRRKVFLRL